MILILQLDDSKAPGPTDIHIKILKIAAPIIVPHLVKILNKSPSNWGFTPIHLNLLKLFLFLKLVIKQRLTITDLYHCYQL